MSKFSRSVNSKWLQPQCLTEWYFQFAQTERCVVEFNRTHLIHATNLPTVLHGRWQKVWRVTRCTVVRWAMNVGFCLQKVNILSTNIVGASVLCGCVDKALPWISVSYVMCLCVSVCVMLTTHTLLNWLLIQLVSMVLVSLFSYLLAQNGTR
jgi:hypothetical protein